jgi:hypothetical protein
MKVTFIYRGSSKPKVIYEKLTEKVIKLMMTIYVLPDRIEIQFENLGPNIYGMTVLDPRFPNRIRINQDLSLEEYMLPLTHELLHLHQMFTNRLQSRSGGRILWDNVLYKVNTLDMSYEDYRQLPWESDVAQKQHKLLSFLQENNRKLKAL